MNPTTQTAAGGGFAVAVIAFVGQLGYDVSPELASLITAAVTFASSFKKSAAVDPPAAEEGKAST